MSTPLNTGAPFNLNKWIAENLHLLKPPVGNKVLWKDQEFIVMAVGGPNQRTDFHVNQGEEFFHQLEGTLTLKIMKDGAIHDVRVTAGDVFLLPPNTPHSPQREAGSVGLVIERRRREGEIDSLQWYCEKCVTKLYEEFFVLTNIETQFPAVFERYYNSEHTTCKNCGHVNGRQWTDQ
jgi:3-hydroxyanthranilate 3,4-dioxygenase